MRKWTIIAAALLAGCGTERAVAPEAASAPELAVTAAGAPATLTRVNGQGQRGAPGDRLQYPLTTKVTDASGNVVPGVTVTYVIVQGVATVENPAPVTDAQGNASTYVRVQNTDQVRIQASVPGTQPVVFTVNPIDPVPATVTRVNGQGQQGAPGTVLPTPLTVNVRNAAGQAVQGATASFVVIEGDATVSPATAGTDNQGNASTRVTLGPTPGVVRVRATVGSVAPVIFTINPQAASQTPASPVGTSGQGQTGTAGSELPNPITVTVRNASGVPLRGIPVTFTVVEGSATLSNPNAVTDAQGNASTRVTLGSTAGTVRIRADVPGLEPTFFTAASTPGAVATVTISPNPITLRVGQQLNLADLTVVARDINGNVVTGRPANCQSNDQALLTLQLLGAVGVALLPGTTSVTCTVDGVSATVPVNITLL